MGRPEDGVVEDVVGFGVGVQIELILMIRITRLILLWANGRGGRGGRGSGRGKNKKRGGRGALNSDIGFGWTATSGQNQHQVGQPRLLASKTTWKRVGLSHLLKMPLLGQVLFWDSINQLKVNEDSNIDWELFKIQGTCQSLEKQYLRLTRAPDPSEVRPIVVLRRALEHFRELWKAKPRPEYLFINEQLKSIRQDLTVQCIRDSFTVEVYECHACIALEVGDREEFNQCASQLKGLYEEGIPGRQLEFTAYRMLYYLNTHDYTQINTTLASLSAQARQEPHVAFALRARAALALNNYYAFFRLLPHAPGHCAAALGWVLARERRVALQVLVKAYRPNLPFELSTPSNGSSGRQRSQL